MHNTVSARRMVDNIDQIETKRLFEDIMEVILDKASSGSGLVFYAQYWWKEVEAHEEAK